VSKQAPVQGRRAKPEALRGARNVHGEIADDIVRAELAALAKQRKGNESWHVVGLDSKLDAAVLSADEHTAIRQLKTEADAELAGMQEDVDDDEEIRRMQEEIAVLDRMAAVMREQPEIPPPHERPQSPMRAHPNMSPARGPDTEQRHHGGAAGNRSADAGVSRGDYFKEEKDKLRAAQEAQQKSYRAQLDEQVLHVLHVCSLIHRHTHMVCVCVRARVCVCVCAFV